MDPRKKIKIHLFSPREGHQKIELGFWTLLRYFFVIFVGFLGIFWIIIDSSLYERLWSQSALKNIRKDNVSLNQTLGHVVKKRTELENSMGKLEAQYEKVSQLAVLPKKDSAEAVVPSTSQELLVHTIRLEEKMDYVSEKFFEQKELLASLPVLYPVRSRRFVSAEFGKRKDPFSGKIKAHYGIDFPGVVGDSIIAPASGTIVEVKKSQIYGLTLTIDHGFGIVTHYTHLQDHLKKQGQSVKRGEVIALLGNSGRSTGPHLHYELIYKDKHLNPALFILPDTYSGI